MLLVYNQTLWRILAKALVWKHRSLVLTGSVGMSIFIPSHFIRLARSVLFIAFFLARYICRLHVVCRSSDGKVTSVCNYNSTEPPSLCLLVLLYLYLFHPTKSRLGSLLFPSPSRPYRPCCILALLPLPEKMWLWPQAQGFHVRTTDKETVIWVKVGFAVVRIGWHFGDGMRDGNVRALHMYLH